MVAFAASWYSTGVHMIPVILEITGMAVGVSCFLGFCHHCYYLPRQYFKCRACGATRQRSLQDFYDPCAGDSTVVVKRIEHECDGPKPGCKDGYMELVVRKWSWWLTRPFAWVWAPLPVTMQAISSLLKKSAG